MAEAAEQVEFKQNQEPLEFLETPKIFAVSEMQRDELTRRRAEKFLSSLGHTVIDSEVELDAEVESDDSNITSLNIAVHLANKGNERARKLVKANVATDVIERTMKVKHIISVGLEVDENREIHQHGQKLDRIQENSWLYATQKWQMRERVRAENNNSFRLKEHYRSGTLEDYSFVEISRAADNMDNKSMKKEGFFTDTMSCVIRITTMKNGVLTTESAFAAGIKKLGEERHDEATIIKMGQALGIDLKDKTAADIIDSPLLIHNELLPNGVVDLVRLYDESAGNSFFGEQADGEAKTIEDYLKVLSDSKNREISLDSKVEDIVNELILNSHLINSPTDATGMLNKLSGKHMVKQAVIDRSINPNVFGDEAAMHIVSARHHTDLGNIELADAASRRAIKVEKSSSCPGAGINTDAETDLFGNTIGDPDSPASKEWHGGKVYKNSKCRSCEKVKSAVGVCHICKDCVGKPAQLKRSYEKHKSKEIKPLRRNKERTLGNGVIKLAA
jgi:hypothetical protein